MKLLRVLLWIVFSPFIGFLYLMFFLVSAIMFTLTGEWKDFSKDFIRKGG